MHQPSLEIQLNKNGTNRSPVILICEAGENSIAFAGINHHNFSLCFYKKFNYKPSKENLYGNWLTTLLEDFKKEDLAFEKVFISFAYSENLLIPSANYKEDINEEQLQLVFGDLLQGAIVDETIHLFDIKNVYRIPSVIFDLFHKFFPEAIFKHQHSVFLKSIPLQNEFALEGKKMYLNFSDQSFTCLILNERELEFSKTYLYTNMTEVIYLLLEISDQFKFDREKNKVLIGGFIDTSSNVYKEIYKFFRYPELRPENPNYSFEENFNEYPKHYFASITDAAQCV